MDDYPSSPGYGYDDHEDLPPIGGLGGGEEEQEEYDRYDIFMPAVQLLVNAIGGYEEMETSPGKVETIYRPGDSVVAVLKDLKKLWRKDDSDDERTVARCMAKAGLMKELISLLVECTDRGEWGRKVALISCDLIAALTWPIDVQQELKEMQDEPGMVTDYASLLRAQLEYKAMILQSNAPLRCLLALMLPSLAKPRKDERDEKIVSLGLHIVRNLLAIKDAVASETTSGEQEELSQLQSTLIVQLNGLTYFQLLLTLASCADKSDLNQYNVLVLDILHLIFRSVKAKNLGQDQVRAPVENLKKLLDLETRKKTLHSRSSTSRHSRFGTTVSVKAGNQKVILHKQNAIKIETGKILDDFKRKRMGKVKKVVSAFSLLQLDGIHASQDELAQPVDLSPEAMKVLQGLGKTFILSCFNTFFATILKDIRMERSKIRPTDSIRTMVLARFFIEYLLILRSKEENPDTSALQLGLVAEMAELESVRWVVTRMKIAMEDKPPAWTELQACIDCFSHVLLLIDAMSTSPDEEDVEVAEILQNQLYYNGDILESSLDVISKYKDQSIAYLDSVVHFAFVLLRMLEKYSKNKSFMFVRKKRAARTRRKKAADNPANSNPVPEEYVDEEGDAEPDRDAPSYAEHAFTFTNFERRFAQEHVVNTLLTYLGRYREFEEADQLKRIVGLMHRQVVKSQAEGLYFRVTALHLFRQILDEQQSLPKGDAQKDLVQLINFILRKFFKKASEDPFLIVEALAPKSRGRWKELSSYRSDEGSDEEIGVGAKKSAKDKSMELEFKKNKKLSWSQQMGVVVSLLVQDSHEDWIHWVIESMEIALAARTEVVLAVDGSPGDHVGQDEDERGLRDFSGPSNLAVEKFERHDLETDNEERKAAMAKNPHLRLMLKLLAFDMTNPDSPETQTWFLPSFIIPPAIATSIGALQQFLSAPVDLDGADPKSLIRKARPQRRRRGSLELSDEEVNAPKVRQKKKAETQIYKSAAFIEDSDDDEEKDRLFFEKEARQRLLNEEMAKKNGGVMQSTGTKRKRKGNGGQGKGKGKDEEMVDEDEVLDSQENEDLGEESLVPDTQMESQSNGTGSESEEEEDAPSRKAKSLRTRVVNTDDDSDD
ncbi:replication fork protection complex subunit TIMELESS/Tof1/Swi1, partial [Tremellales sp. Uapishka_1]